MSDFIVRVYNSDEINFVAVLTITAPISETSFIDYHCGQIMQALIHHGIITHPDAVLVSMCLIVPLGHVHISTTYRQKAGVRESLQPYKETLRKALNPSPFVIQGFLNPQMPYNMFGRISTSVTKDKELELMEHVKDETLSYGESITMKENP